MCAQVPVNTKVEASKPSLTPEELKAKQQELRYSNISVVDISYILEYLVSCFTIVFDVGNIYVCM